MNWTLTGTSTALFSTWYFIEELNLLLDAGDGVVSNLLQKSQKIKHAFVTHPDRDHLAGLLALRQLNARSGGYPRIYYPKDSGSFPALRNFSEKFSPDRPITDWQPLDQGSEISIRPDVVVRAIRNEHIEVAPELIKSLSYEVQLLRRKLKPELQGQSPEQLKALRQAHGNDFITTEQRVSLLSYSGDTPVVPATVERWQHSHTLIHEATFLDLEGITNRKKHLHSSLNQVLEMVPQTQVQRLVLGHFSSRYSPAQIDAAILARCIYYGIHIPVYRLLPGHVHRNLWAEAPINATLL